ncbi:MAG: Gfo/Idh/MocA family oxidoreductase, partial [Acidobacteriaceae bacterium]|nr:Gfo/Idh/MocA family oxidoreductase [Acidobacteriaceae bacterium]
MASNTTLRVGIAGFGRLAREYYVPVLQRMGGVNIVAVADPFDDSRRAAGRLAPAVRTYTSVDEMCGTAELHAVLVASPPSSHLASWNTAREHGLATFLEKPLAMTSQLQALPQLTDTDARVMLNFNRRFWPAYQRFSEAVREDRLGRLQSIELTLRTAVLKWSTVTQHRLSSGDGGVLHDLGTQAVDVVCQITGQEPVSISATQTRDASHFEQITLEMKFADSVQGRCFLGYGPANRESLIVTGTDKTMVLREPNMMPHIVNRSGSLRAHHYFADYTALGYRFVAARQRML